MLFNTHALCSVHYDPLNMGYYLTLHVIRKCTVSGGGCNKYIYSANLDVVPVLIDLFNHLKSLSMASKSGEGEVHKIICNFTN